MKKPSDEKNPRRPRKSPAKPDENHRCGLCGKSERLTKTECCGNWICDDEEDYIIFSFARNSCSRNHRRYTLCGFHHTERHPGLWKDCAECRDQFETEIFVYYGTNEYNFEKLENPPSYEPTHCNECGRVINLAEEDFSQLGNEYSCEQCSAKKMRQLLANIGGPKPAPETRSLRSIIKARSRKRKGRAKRR